MSSNELIMASKAQSALEWLMTHSWAVLVILLVGFTLAHLGFFEASARPRFEGLRAAGIQPIPSEVQLYSDGILVLIVQNTRPYSMRHDWVEIAPISDPGDRIRTTVNGFLGQGDVGTYTINASNLAGSITANMLLLKQAGGKTTYTDFLYSHQETHLIPGGDPQIKTYTDAKATQITTYSTPQGGGGGGGSWPTGCQKHRKCDCGEPVELVCQECAGDMWDNYKGCLYISGDPEYFCWPKEEGSECINHNGIQCDGSNPCPLACQKCSEGYCQNDCVTGTCTWIPIPPYYYCKIK